MSIETPSGKFTAVELKQIDEADDLKIAPFREDGKTYGTPTWVWEVVVNGELYVRAYNGTSSRWYEAAIRQKAGRIHAAGMAKEVVFESVASSEINQLIDQAYQDKYSKSPNMVHMIGGRAKAATIKIVPQTV